MPEIEVAPADELPPGSVKIVVAGSIHLGVYNIDGEYFAIEDRCSHDDGPLCEGDWEPDDCVVTCPRHGARFDLASGRPLSLPAFQPVAVFPVEVQDGIVRVELP
jgi:3-phenylpropionate/trans-cinnamate dioxygenase ferredoxin subunit